MSLEIPCHSRSRSSPFAGHQRATCAPAASEERRAQRVWRSVAPRDTSTSRGRDRRGHVVISGLVPTAGRSVMDKVVHFETQFDDKARASKFYSSVFGWKLTDIPQMSYVMAETT